MRGVAGIRRWQVCLAVLCMLTWTPQRAVATEWPAFWSVVQIHCTMGQMRSRATGFVWPEAGQVVTALHAVAGCQEIVVWSELRGRETLARITNVNLEADLALLRLDNDLMLSAVPHATDPPDIRARYFAWGYPTAAAEMIELSIEFAGGLSGGTTTLGRAFASTDLDRLFRDQPYPNPRTQILRTPTTIQPGQSGAPIFDGAGRVVAIVDGGLLEGLRLVNWTIPAHVYLPDLPWSTDPTPNQPSAWAALFSAVEPSRSVTVELGASETEPEAAEPDDGPAPGDLVLLGWLPLAVASDRLGLGGEGGMVQDIRSHLSDPEDFDALSFGIFQDSAAGATYAIPAGMWLAWNDALGAVEATNDSGKVALAAAVHRSAGFAQAVDEDLERFITDTSTLAEWTTAPAPLDLEYEAFDEQAQIAGFTGAFTGVSSSRDQLEVVLHLAANGPVSVAARAAALLEDDLIPDADFVDYRMAEFAARFLTMDSEAFKRVGLSRDVLSADSADLPLATAPLIEDLEAPEGLVYTGQINLRAFAEAEGLDGDGSIVAEIAALLDDPEVFDRLGFRIFEDKERAGIYAVPDGAWLYWDPELGLFQAFGEGGRVHMSASVLIAESFDQAIATDIQSFVAAEASMATWDGPSPADFAWDHFDPEEQFARFDAALTGRARESGDRFETVISLEARCCTAVSLSTSIRAPIDNLTPADEFEYLMMEFGARFLTEFTPSFIASRYYRHMTAFGPGGLGNWSVVELTAGAPVPQPESLTLVRQISLAQVAETLEPEDYDFYIAPIRHIVEDPEVFAALGFEIYEERLTGASLAVSFGFRDLEWNDALGVVETQNPSGTVKLSATVRRLGSFAEVVLSGAEGFVDHIDSLLDWSGETRPATFQHDYVEIDEEYSVFSDFYFGLDTETGREAEVMLGVHTDRTALIATAVSAVWDLQSDAAQDPLDYLMMQIAVLFLTNFALR